MQSFRAVIRVALFIYLRFHFKKFEHKKLLLLVTLPIPRDGGMVDDHGAPEARQLPRVWTKGRTETESCQRVSDAKSP